MSALARPLAASAPDFGEAGLVAHWVRFPLLCGLPFIGKPRARRFPRSRVGRRTKAIAMLVWTISFCIYPASATLAENPAVPINLLVVIYDPIIKSRGGGRLHEVMGWQDPNVLTDQLVNDFRIASHGLARYKVVQRIMRDEWPLHLNGRRYTDELYLEETAAGNWTLGPGDYLAIIADNAIRQKVNQGRVDEVWLWGGPGFGWWESAMAGNGAYWINEEGQGESGANHGLAARRDKRPGPRTVHRFAPRPSLGGVGRVAWRRRRRG